MTIILLVMINISNALLPDGKYLTRERLCLFFFREDRVLRPLLIPEKLLELK